eukprot:TRINITY_DN35496_c0_g1_i2.p1 TRINITY_DN35496_c0_g1~~TRINITY_DN35496_c0_g1_i2.p1  ORF type:complete len:1382 (-),score=399.94 TRINITY_DN35496_c0_g1_i2:118-4263(-)
MTTEKSATGVSAGANHGIQLELTHAFGSLAAANSFRDAAFFGDESGRLTVIPAGRHVMLRHMESGETTFVQAPQHVEAITAFVVSRDKGYMAVGQRCRGTPQAQIAIYDMRLENIADPIYVAEPLGSSVATGKVIAMAFASVAPFMLAALCQQGSQVSLVILDWQDARIVAKQVLPGGADRVNFAPHDPYVLSVSGQHLVRILRLQNVASKSKEAQLKLMPALSKLNEDASRFTDHAWCEPGEDGIVVTCTSDGTVYVLDVTELAVVALLDPVFQDESNFGQTAMAFSVRCFSQGFVVGGGDGTIAVWERMDNPPGPDGEEAEGPSFEFKHVRTMQARRTDAAICSMDISGSEENVILTFRNADVGILPMTALHASAGAAAEVECSIVNGGFHCGPLVGLDIAVHRPLFVSACKKDSSVRIWNYITKSCELSWQLPGEPPSGVAIHPLGYFVAVSFQEKLRFYHLLLRELKLYREVNLSGGRMLRYSHGGHFLAMVQGQNVVVVSTESLMPVVTIEGHSEKVTALCFDPDDSTLLTASMDGTVALWSTRTWEKVHEYAASQREYTNAVLGPGSDILGGAVYGSKNFLQIIKQDVLIKEQELADKERMSVLCRHPSGFVAWGSTTGVLSAYTGAALAASEGSTVARPLADFGLHNGAMTMLCMSADGKTLITGGDDGAMFMLAVQSHVLQESPNADIIPETQGHRLSGGTETVLIDRNEIQQRNEELRLLRAEAAALSAKLREEATRLEEECQMKVFEARQKDQAEISELRRRCKALEQATTAKEIESQRIMKEMATSHSQAAEQLNHLYDKKLEYEGERYVSMQAARVEMQEQMKEFKEQATKQLEEQAQKHKEDLERLIAEKDLEIRKHKDMIAFAQHRFDNMLEEEQMLHNIEITETKMRSDAELEKQKQVEARLRKEQNVLIEGLQMMEKDHERSEKEQHEAATTISALRSQSEELQRTVGSLKGERKERESALKEKESKIESYKAKVNTLKKFKHVLDKQLLEVTDSLQPKDHMIHQLNAHLAELESEFEKQLVDQRAIEAQIDKKMQHVAFLTNEGETLRTEVQDKDRIITGFTQDLHSLVTENKDYNSWPREIRKLYHTYVCGHVNREDRLPLEELRRQLRLKERQVTSLAVKAGQNKATCKSDIQRKAHESSLLVHELNELRVQKKTLQMNVRTLQRKLETLNRQLSGVAAGADGPVKMLADLGDGMTPTLPPPRSSSAQGSTASLPRAPSGGSLPGPRQQLGPGGGTRAASPGGTVRPRSAIGGAPGRNALQDRLQPQQKALTAMRLTPEDKNRLENLRVTQDMNRSTLDAQKAENKMLRDKLSEVLKDAKPSSAGASSAAARTGETLQAAATTLPATGSRVGANVTRKKRVL